MTTTVADPAPARPTGAVRRGRPARPPHRGLLGLGGVATLAAVVELLPRVGLVNSRFMPPFSEMVSALSDRVGTADFWRALGETLTTWGIGLSIAVLAGTLLGMVIGSVGWLRETTASLIEFLRPIPSVALIPLAVLLYGTGREATLLLVIYASFWQVLLQVLAGVRDIDPVARDTARSYRFRRLTTATRLAWPTTLPYAVVGFRLAASVALILTVTGELIIGTDGIGRLIAVAQTSGAVASMYALIIVTGLLGVAVNLLARLVERRLLRWHPSVRQESAS
ncbi:ABC transporter permease [Streptomyces profundus]|uniref:ABC transporter permease n=1 Tax=Streptomyces profundus TaxID=2867410 RepID=UPI001D16EEB1|nr:ABC transporter permease [Streptomyces sp. MA3_2.13]UED87906.1 ABC transporter permease [Streptomyces sp. MA3_2.13]